MILLLLRVLGKLDMMFRPLGKIKLDVKFVECYCSQQWYQKLYTTVSSVMSVIVNLLKNKETEE